MNEKRFRFERECTENFFTEKGVFYNNERPMSANEIIALLNSLYDENEQLEKGKMEALSLLGEEIDENEQLKKRNKFLDEMIYKLQWRFQQEVGIEKAEEHFQEIHKEMNNNG